MRALGKYKWPVAGVLIAGVLALVYVVFGGSDWGVFGYSMFVGGVGIPLVIFALDQLADDDKPGAD